MKNSQIKYFAKMLGETFEKDDFYVKFFPKEEQRKKFIYELFLMRMKIFGNQVNQSGTVRFWILRINKGNWKNRNM